MWGIGPGGGHIVAEWRPGRGRVIVEGMAQTTATAPEPHPHATRENILFGGVYGAVLACSMVAALTQYGHTDRGAAAATTPCGYW